MYVREIYRNPEMDGGGYFDRIPAIAALDTLKFSKPVTFFVGENGAGKSTLLEAVAVSFGFNAEGGTRNFNFSSKSTHSELYRSIRLVKEPVRPRDGYFLRAESFYNAATYLDEIDDGTLMPSYGGRSLHAQSHGESFLALMSNRFGGHGFYILDEPEAALSPSRQLSLIRLIYDLVNAGSQFIIATHSPILMAYPGAELYLLDESGIHRTSYEQTEHYQITRRFMENPKRMLDVLLSDE